MERRAFALGFVLAFTGVLALIVGFSAPGPTAEAASTSSPAATRLIQPRPAPPVLAAPVTGTPSVEGSEPFGRLMPDGTRCGVGCPDEDHP